MTRLPFVLAILIFFSFGLHAKASVLLPSKYKKEEGTCFPLSSQKFEIGTKSLNVMTELEFNQILDKLHGLMNFEVKRRMNKNLVVEKRWADSTVDAFATRDDVNNPVIVMQGGLARHPQMTRDGLALIFCHELGHHLGGAPKILRGNSGLRGWSSAEGQADYFATSKCLPHYFQAEKDLRSYDLDINPADLASANEKCSDNICVRTVLAGLAVSRTFASLVQGTPEPKLTIKDSTKVTKTLYKHPNPQCRLDTFSSGANCELGIDIPFDAQDPQVGACMKDKGARPFCWFSEEDF
jgi:hypothetical protein